MYLQRIMLPHYHFHQHMYLQRQHFQNCLNCPLMILGILMITPSAMSRASDFEPSAINWTALNFFQGRNAWTLHHIQRRVDPPCSAAVARRSHINNQHVGRFFYFFVLNPLSSSTLIVWTSDVWILCLVFLGQNTLSWFVLKDPPGQIHLWHHMFNFCTYIRVLLHHPCLQSSAIHRIWLHSFFSFTILTFFFHDSCYALM